MTKHEWFTCDDIRKLVQQVKSDRKKELIALACCKVALAAAKPFWVTDAQVRAKQLDLLRDIYNPFLLDIKFSDQAISLAHQVYEGDDSARGVLSDYLEDARYPAEIVRHLKSGFHPKGCWLVDQILENK